VIFTLLLPLLAGEGGWVGEVYRTHVDLLFPSTGLQLPNNTVTLNKTRHTSCQTPLHLHSPHHH